MKKIINKIVYFQALILLIFSLCQTTALGASPKIVDIKNLSITAKLNQKCLLPKTIQANMSDKTVKSVSVIWDKKTLDTSKVGIYTFKGTVKEYKPKVTLTVKVISDKPNKPIISEPTQPLPSASNENIYDKWSYKKDLSYINETKSSTIDYTGYSNIRFSQPNNDVNKAVSCGNKIIYIHNDGKVMEYDPVEDSWKDKYVISELSKSDGDFHIVSIENLVYIIGVNFTDILVYNPSDNKCSLETKLLTKRRIGGVVTTNGKIYILGGFDGSIGSTISNLEEYDPAIDKWTTKANMKQGANSIIATALNDKIYVFNRLWNKSTDTVTKNTYSIEEYDIINDKWITKTSTSNNSIIFDSFQTVNNKIYVISLKTDLKTDNYRIYVDEYDPNTNKWMARANSVSTERNKFASVVFNGEIYIIGGITYNPQPKDPNELSGNPTANNEYVKTIQKYTPPKP